MAMIELAIYVFGTGVTVWSLNSMLTKASS